MDLNRQQFDNLGADKLSKDLNKIKNAFQVWMLKL